MEMKISKRKVKASHNFETVFDVREIAQSIDALSAPALERLLCQLGDDISSLPFDIFICDLVPAAWADGTDKIIIKLRLRTSGELFAAT